MPQTAVWMMLYAATETLFRVLFRTFSFWHFANFQLNHITLWYSCKLPGWDL